MAGAGTYSYSNASPSTHSNADAYSYSSASPSTHSNADASARRLRRSLRQRGLCSAGLRHPSELLRPGVLPSAARGGCALEFVTGPICCYECVYGAHSDESLLGG